MIMVPPFIAGFLLALPIAAPAQDRPKTESEIRDALADYMEAEAEKGGFSGSVIVARGGKPLLRIGHGMAEREHESPNTPGSKFRIGSITKPFTAVLTLMLAEQGKLALDDPIAKLDPEAPEAWAKVTIRHLLNHTSGIPSFTGLPSYEAEKSRPVTHEQMIARFRDLPLEFDPGSKFNYSNSGYYLLGVLLERAGGQPYEDLLREHVLGPLEMADTGYDRFDQVLPGRAQGYERRGEQVAHSDYLSMTQPFAAGALYSTVDDLLKFDRALLAGKLLSAESFETLYRPVHDDYACGWVVRDRDGRRAIGHNGGIDGFQTALLRFPDEEICVVVLANVVPAPVERIANDLARLAMGEEVVRPEDRKVVEVDPAVFDAYVGRYRLSPEVELTVSREDDALFIAGPGAPKVALKAESEEIFFATEIDGTITFVREGDGKATHLILRQGGPDQKAERIAE